MFTAAGNSPVGLPPPQHEPDVGGHDGQSQGGVQAVLHSLPRHRLQVTLVHEKVQAHGRLLLSYLGHVSRYTRL
jgi:hypothetical protein